MTYDLQKIISVIRSRYFISYQKSNYLADMGGKTNSSYQAGFENMTCEWNSQNDIFIQKLWEMSYEGKKISVFDKASENWQDNYICDIREL